MSLNPVYLLALIFACVCLLLPSSVNSDTTDSDKFGAWRNAMIYNLGNVTCLKYARSVLNLNVGLWGVFTLKAKDLVTGLGCWNVTYFCSRTLVIGDTLNPRQDPVFNTYAPSFYQSQIFEDMIPMAVLGNYTANPMTNPGCFLITDLPLDPMHLPYIPQPTSCPACNTPIAGCPQKYHPLIRSERQPLIRSERQQPLIRSVSLSPTPTPTPTPVPTTTPTTGPETPTGLDWNWGSEVDHTEHDFVDPVEMLLADVSSACGRGDGTLNEQCVERRWRLADIVLNHMRENICQA